MQAGGRLSLVELPALLGVDLVHCERQAAVLVAESNGAVLEAQGELITTQVSAPTVCDGRSPPSHRYVAFGGQELQCPVRSNAALTVSLLHPLNPHIHLVPSFCGCIHTHGPALNHKTGT
jgi:hypothetical protein